MPTFADKSLVDTLAGGLLHAVPEIVLVAFACLLILQGMLIRARGLNFLLAFFGIVAAMGTAGFLLEKELDAASTMSAEAARIAPLIPGPFAQAIRGFTLIAGLLILLLSTKDAVKGIAGEYYACLLVALAGTSLVARANDLATLYLALEMISIPTYVLLYLPSRSQAAQEAASKYFLLSILSSGILLFGLSHLYGLAGTTNITAMVETLAAAHTAGASPLAVLAMVLVVAGLAFRITAVPFHYYAPDVYQGAPTGVVAQLAVLPKIAGFAALARLMGLATLPVDDLPFPAATQIPLMFWVMAAVTMTVGNVMAVIQDNLKRLLAYSGIAHTGYMLLGLLASAADASGPMPYVTGLDAILVYLAAYTLMTLGAFAVIIHANVPARPVETVDDLAGLGRTSPVAAACLAIALLSLIGLPLTAGFSGKLMLFWRLLDAPDSGGLNKILVAIAALNAAIGAVYYLRLLGVLYLRTPLDSSIRSRGTGPLVAALLCAAGTLALGLAMNALPTLARMAVPAVK